MESLKSHDNSLDSEMSLKDLVLKVLDWCKYYIKSWKVILAFLLVGASIGLTLSFITPPKYIAQLTFVLEDNNSSPFASYVGLASQFGIDLGGGAGNGIFTGDNIIEFLKSRLLIEKTLLTEVKIADKSMSLADYYIAISGIKTQWEKSPSGALLKFPYDLPRHKFSILQDSALGIVYQNILSSHLKVAKPDKKLNFIAVSCTSQDEQFAKLFTERLVAEAISFYINIKTQRSKAIVDKLQSKADSIQNLLSKKTYSVAASKDLNLNPAKSIAMVNSELGTIDKVMLQTMYAEVVKNLEISKTAMAQEMPVIQIIDTPILPLKKERLGKLKGVIIGQLASGFLIILILGVRKLYKEIMEQ